MANKMTQQLSKLVRAPSFVRQKKDALWRARATSVALTPTTALFPSMSSTAAAAAAAAASPSAVAVAAPEPKKHAKKKAAAVDEVRFFCVADCRELSFRDG